MASLITGKSNVCSTAYSTNSKDNITAQEPGIPLTEGQLREIRFHVLI